MMGVHSSVVCDSMRQLPSGSQSTSDFGCLMLQSLPGGRYSPATCTMPAPSLHLIRSGGPVKDCVFTAPLSERPTSESSFSVAESGASELSTPVTDVSSWASSTISLPDREKEFPEESEHGQADDDSISKKSWSRYV